MAVETKTFIRKPLYVEAVRITGANFDAVCSWCQGEVMQDDVPGRGRSKKYIKVDVHNPKNPRQTKAKVGDWLLKTEKGYKIYTDKAFHESFHLVEEDTRSEQELGAKESLETARGEGLISESEEVVPGVTVVEAIRLLRAHARIQDEIGPGVELVPATPEAIAQAVNENEAARRQEEKVAEGKRVLSVEEQKEMDADEIRELIQSGEVILAQDIAA